MKDQIKEYLFKTPIPAIAYPDDYFFHPIIGNWIGKEVSHSETPRLRWTRAIFRLGEPQERRFNGEQVRQAGDIIYIYNKKDLRICIENAMSNGLVTGNTESEINSWHCKIEIEENKS